MIKGEGEISDRAVFDYFSRRYPGRGGLVARFFRAGEDARLTAMAGMLPDCAGKRIIDVGCGDGLFLSEIIRGRPSLIRIEDVVAENVSAAERNLHGKADRVEAVARDFFTSEEEGKYDVAISIGLTDYVADWDNFIDKLDGLLVGGGVMIVDFSKTGTLRIRLRKVWLGLNKVNVYAASKENLNILFRARYDNFEIAELEYNWMVKAVKDGA